MKKVLVITGNTGTGKTTVADYLKRHYDIPQVITHTTRAPRQGELDGQDYYFETPETFQRLHLLEHVQYSYAAYGSSYEGLERAWQKAPVISIVLDTAGAITYQKALGAEAVVLYLTIGKTGLLAERLLARGDDPVKVQARLNSAEYQRDLAIPKELAQRAYVIKNDDWKATEQRLGAIISEIITKQSD
ncbi:guanylate kinase [Weissella kandleri]|uniref:Guanylate kinase n=1 Tax=Weissella kandleri TaxID=1616 RepID=A0A0R2JKV6_9LACO|nr:guanylate kinase [Weissella kandleri]KRN75404.1 guanylate kinase [Weissella kandleri]